MARTLANSLVWKDTGPTRSQRMAPWLSTPRPGTSTAASSAMARNSAKVLSLRRTRVGVRRPA